MLSNLNMIELVDIEDIVDSHHYNMVDITVEEDESFLLSSGIISHNSAKSQISEARDPKTTAAYALTGKINNVWDCTPAQALKMGKITEMLMIIGLTPGKKAVKSNLNYGKIVIATDSDVDGDDIFTLLVCLFYKFWPELFDEQDPVVHRLVAPNVVASKGTKRVHFTTRQEFEQIKDKYNGWNIEYMKGLGSLSKQDWNTILSSDFLIPFINDGSLQPALELLFGESADLRKSWLTADSQ